MYIPTLGWLVSLAAAAPHVSPLRRASLACTPGQLICRGMKQWGLCTTTNSIAWMMTSPGTSCVCISPANCMIVAAGITDEEVSSLNSNPVTTPTPLWTPTKSVHITSTSLRTSTTTTPLRTPPASLHATSPSSPSSVSSTNTHTTHTTQTGNPRIPDQGMRYTQFTGNGSPQAGWPTIDKWLSFEKLFQLNQPIGQGCETAFGVPNNSPNDTQALHDALLEQAKAAGVPAQFALAITLQESLGCVFVPTTNNAVRNPGLMQDHDGSSSCAGKSVCPASEIQGMLQQGLNGTATGDGIRQCHAQAPGPDPAQRWYQAARIYNAGSLSASGDLAANSVGVPCYAPDVANRLIGWANGPSLCNQTAGKTWF